MKSMFARGAAWLALATLWGGHAAAQLTVNSVQPGYNVSSLELGQPFAGALAFDPANPDRLFASYGSFGDMRILRMDAATLTTATVAGPFGNVGGIAVLGNGDLALTENFTSDTIIRARDLNSDGDFLDEDEVTTLIEPILADGDDFSGAQIAVAPAGNIAGIPAGSLVVQTADGQTSSELLVVQDPESATPSFFPSGGAYFSGFQYNGGFGFSTSGYLVHGESLFDTFTFSSTGRVCALMNANSDSDIDPGEEHEVVGTAQMPFGLTDLSVSVEDRVFFTEGTGQVRSFVLPGNPATGSASPSVFAETNGAYLSTARIDRPGESFGFGGTAKLYVGGYAAGFVQASNLLVFTPGPVTAAEDWTVYE